MGLYQNYIQKAEAGDKEAQYQTGIAYQSCSSGVEQDHQKSFQWLMRAAEQGHAQAQCEIGVNYSLGLGVKQDLNQALIWYRKAADQEYGNGFRLLALAYEMGEGVEKNTQTAEELYRRAFPLIEKLADTGDVVAERNLGWMYLFGSGVDLDKPKARALFKKAALKGDSASQYRFAHMCVVGEGGPVDTAEALRWAFQSEEQGLAEAQMLIASMYDLGIFLQKDEHQSFKFSQKAAQQNYSIGLCSVGYCYEYGKGTEQNLEKAFKLYSQALENGYYLAWCYLGVMYWKGKFVDKDEKKAFDYFIKAAEFDEPSAQNNLGRMNEFGDGIKKDLDQAIQWYIKSAAQGCESAINNLNRIATNYNHPQAKSWLDKNGKTKKHFTNFKLTINGVGSVNINAGSVQQPKRIIVEKGMQTDDMDLTLEKEIGVLKNQQQIIQAQNEEMRNTVISSKTTMEFQIAQFEQIKSMLIKLQPNVASANSIPISAHSLSESVSSNALMVHLQKKERPAVSDSEQADESGENYLFSFLKNPF